MANSKEVQARADAKRAGTRSRHWTCMVYPESAPKNWESILREQLVDALISPLHDMDTNGDTGEIKKAHYHVVISFHNPCGYEKAENIFKAFGGIGNEYESRVKDFRQMARYLCHLDQPDKYRYNVNDVISIGSTDYHELIMSRADEDELLDEILSYIDENKIISYADLLRRVRIEHPEWRRVVYHKFTIVIVHYIKSLCWEWEHENDPRIK